jgi:SAM-dependent methyltransferase
MKGFIHRIVARPAVYDIVQSLAGAEKVRRRLAAALARAGGLATRASDPGGRLVVVDVGGGTGGWRGLWPADASYIGADLDEVKLQGMRARHPSALAIQADAARLPLADGRADAVGCTLMSHHLPDETLEAALRECARILRPGGVLAFADAVWSPRRLPGRVLWHYDRGSFPRTPAVLRAAIDRCFDVQVWEPYAVFHAYILCVATPRTQSRTTTT